MWTYTSMPARAPTRSDHPRTRSVPGEELDSMVPAVRQDADQLLSRARPGKLGQVCRFRRPGRNGCTPSPRVATEGVGWVRGPPVVPLDRGGTGLAGVRQVSRSRRIAFLLSILAALLVLAAGSPALATGVTLELFTRPGCPHCAEARRFTEGLAALYSEPGVMDDVIGRIPAGRIGAPSDIGNAVAFLASPASSFVTGQSITIDGGQTLPEVQG